MSLPALPLNAWLRWDVVRRLVPRDVRTILEVGCGQGAVGTRLAVDHDYLGVEPDGTSYATAAQRLAEVGRGAVLNGMVDDVVEPGRTFDLVCAFEVLEHLEDDAAAVAGWVDRVRPGGWLLLSTPAFQSRYGPFDTIVGHYRRYELADMRALLGAAGLTEIEVVAYGAGLGEVLEAARNVVGRRRLAAGGVDAGAGHSGVATGTTTAPTAAEMAAMTSASGRLMQPPAALATATQAVTAPFRWAQRRYPERGTGLVARARRPVPAS